jgi:hypothetical protein
MAMTKKDYKLIADCISEQLSHIIDYNSDTARAVRYTLEFTANELANRFEHTNPAFNKEKFMLAAISRSAL